MSKLKKCGVNEFQIEKHLFTYGATNPLKINTKISADIVCEESMKRVKADFMVIDGNHTPLLGRKTAQELGILSIGFPVNMINTESDIVSKYSELFSGLDKLKDYQLKIHVDENVKPIGGYRLI